MPRFCLDCKQPRPPTVGNRKKRCDDCQRKHRTITCPCGKVFIAPRDPDGRHYLCCSNVCKHKYRPKPRIHQPQTCACGKVYQPRMAGRVACSLKCGAAHRVNRLRELGYFTRVRMCVTCNREHTIPTGKFPGRRQCHACIEQSLEQFPIRPDPLADDEPAYCTSPRARQMGRHNVYKPQVQNDKD